MENTNLRDKLRKETQLLHRELEDATGMQEEHLSEEVYINYLKNFYSFFHTLEHYLDQCELKEITRFYGEDRKKLEFIKRDLIELGLSQEEINDIRPYPRENFPLGDSLWGIIYVVEGSTLGGQVLTKRIAQSSKITRKDAVNFVNVYGNETGARWQETIKKINGLKDENISDQDVVDGALWTFESLRNLFHYSLNTEKCPLNPGL